MSLLPFGMKDCFSNLAQPHISGLLVSLDYRPQAEPLLAKSHPSLPSPPANWIFLTWAELGGVVFCKSCSSCPAFANILPFYACFLLCRRLVSPLVCSQALLNTFSTIESNIYQYLILTKYRISNDAMARGTGFPHLTAHLLSQCHVFWCSPPGPQSSVFVKIRLSHCNRGHKKFSGVNRIKAFLQ